MLDERDRRILGFLQEDAGISVTDLAGHVALSVSACSRRIQRLEESGHIARRIVGMWRNSPPHRAILLQGNFRRIGIARRHGIWTADFASRR